MWGEKEGMKSKEERIEGENKKERKEMRREDSTKK